MATEQEHREAQLISLEHSSDGESDPVHGTNSPDPTPNSSGGLDLKIKSITSIMGYASSVLGVKPWDSDTADGLKHIMSSKKTKVKWVLGK
tara:strand:- start:851 stop:1123 length:273 start_codon:yes stop_codon:yes gene_type:complete